MSTKIVFDTETTGLPPYAVGRKGYIDPVRFLEWNDCRVVQIAWMVINDESQIISKKDYIIKPKYFMIPIESTKIHGISQEIAKERGVPIEFALQEFLQDLQEANLIISHNIDFDYSVVLAEIYRAHLDPYHLQCVPKHCTMKRGSLPNEKWSKLAELYEKYFNKKPELLQHRALNDVELCYEVYVYQSKKPSI